MSNGNYKGFIPVRNKTGIPINPAQEDGHLANIPGLSVPVHDYIELGYTGDNLTSIIYKINGETGEIVATLILTYEGDKLKTITKT